MTTANPRGFVAAKQESNMQEFPAWGQSTSYGSAIPSLPPKRRSNALIIALAIGVAAFWAVVFCIGKHAVERYVELSREAATKKHVDDDGAARDSREASSATADAAPLPAPSDGVTVDLGEEGDLSLPAGSIPMERIPLPADVARDVGYQLSGDRLLMVTMSKPQELACGALLDREEKTRRGANASGPERRMRVVLQERRRIGDAEGIYSELDTRTEKEEQRNAPFHHGLGYLFCGRRAVIFLTLTRRSGALTAEDRSELNQIVLSRSPARGKLLVANVPPGYFRVSADAPELDANARAEIERGDIFLWDASHKLTLEAHAVSNYDATLLDDCEGSGAAVAKSAGGSLISAGPVALPFAKVCRIDARVDSLHIRSFVWPLNDHLAVMVACAPFDETTPFAATCMRFASSVKAN